MEQTWAAAGAIGNGICLLGKEVSAWRAQVSYSNILGKV